MCRRSVQDVWSVWRLKILVGGCRLITRSMSGPTLAGTTAWSGPVESVVIQVCARRCVMRPGPHTHGSLAGQRGRMKFAPQ